MAVNFVDFDLHIWRAGDQYLAEVTRSPAGPSEQEVLRWPFRDQPHETLLLRLENAILKASGYRRGPASAEEDVLREFGTGAFRAVLKESNSVADRYRESLALVEQQPDTGLRLNLRVDSPELSMLPWEYVFDDSRQTEHFICLRPASPLVRFMSFTGNVQLPVNGPLRILGMIANPRADLRAEEERRRIEEALEDEEIPRDAVHFRWVQGGTLDHLFHQMQKGPWHVFHFIGHGGADHHVDSDGTMRTEGYVLMEDGLGGEVKVPASQLGITLGGENVRLAVFNCCDSARGTGFSSVGAAVVGEGVPIVVAMQFAITDTSAARFAAMFYKSLISGQPVERALTVARRFMWLASKVEWGIPVMFTRARSGVLFPPLAASPGGLAAPPEPSARIRTQPKPVDPAVRKQQEARELLQRLWERKA